MRILQAKQAIFLKKKIAGCKMYRSSQKNQCILQNYVELVPTVHHERKNSQSEESFETAKAHGCFALSLGSGFAYQAEWVGVMTAIAIAHSKGWKYLGSSQILHMLFFY